MSQIWQATFMVVHFMGYVFNTMDPPEAGISMIQGDNVGCLELVYTPEAVSCKPQNFFRFYEPLRLRLRPSLRTGTPRIPPLESS